MEEVEEVENVADENCHDLCKSFANKVDSMPFDKFKSNTNPTSSSKTPESKTARSAPSRMDLVLDPTNSKETNSAPTTKGRVFPTVTRLSGGESTTSKINKVPSGNQFMMKPASQIQISQVRISPSQIHIGQVSKI